MAIQNAFAIGLAYAKREVQEVQKTPTTTTSREESWSWCVMTNDPLLRTKVLKELKKIGNLPHFGVVSRYFGDKDNEMIDIPYALAKKIYEDGESNFIIFYRTSALLPWSISKKLTRADLSDYFGIRFQGTYQTTGKKKLPKKVT